MQRTHWLKAFAKDARGNTAIMFALAALPMMIMAGGVIDLTSSYSMKAKLQKAVDAAALATAAAYGLNEDESRQAGVKTFQSNFAMSSGSGPVTPAITIKDSEVVVTARAKAPASFLKLVRIDSIDIAARAVVKRSYGTLEVALVLDNTKSMAGSKLTTLKSASRNLVSTLFSEGKAGRIRVSVVPYATYVNVGTDKRGAFWMDAPADRDIPHAASCRYQWTWKRTNCRPATCTKWEDGVSSTYTCRKCDWVKDEYKKVCSGAWTQHIRWHGCVSSRAYPLNTGDDSYSSVKVPGVPNVWCQQPIQPLTADKDSVETKLDAMTADVNGTYIPGGLAWGWRTLSSKAPYSEGADDATAKAKHINKALVLMTDGDNTCDPSYSAKRHYCGPGKGAQADNLTTELCANIKKAGIHLYTVAFNVSDPATKSMLQACASDPSSYFDAGDNSALLAAFKDISRSLARLYLAE